MVSSSRRVRRSTSPSINRWKATLSTSADVSISCDKSQETDLPRFDESDMFPPGAVQRVRNQKQETATNEAIQKREVGPFRRGIRRFKHVTVVDSEVGYFLRTSGFVPCRRFSVPQVHGLPSQARLLKLWAMLKSEVSLLHEQRKVRESTFGRR